jgi:hypothetical protein
MQTIVTATDETVVRDAGVPLARYAAVEAGEVRWKS